MRNHDPILIYGGVEGIGAQLARRLVASGRRVVVTCRKFDRAQAFAREIGAGALAVDVTDEAAIAASIADAAPDGRLAGLVYAVGSVVLKPLCRVSSEELVDAYRINVIGAALAVKHAAEALRAASGSVVLLSSVAATEGLRNHAIVGPTKTAIEGLAVSLAAELAPSARVNAIAPSRAASAATVTARGAPADALTALQPSEHIGASTDVAALAAFLLSPEAGWISGRVFGIDGGRGSLRAGKA